MQKLPLFFNYKEERTDNGYESIQDFFLSWTIRCSSQEFNDCNSLLNGYSKRIVFALIFGNNKIDEYIVDKPFVDTFKVLKVNTLRQFGLIDLIAVVEIEINDTILKYVLNIENKWYSGIRNGQLKKSHEIIRGKYINQNVEFIDLVIFCDYEKINDSVISVCEENGYKFLAIEDLKRYSGITHENQTNNNLFDEYWLNF